MTYPLTIAIPTYNRAKYLVRALSCIEKQTGIEKIEILISDNHSTDETFETLTQFKKRIPNFNYVINEKNMGMSFNISQAFDKANGDYVWIMGDDDYLYDNAIEKVLSIIQNKSNIGVIYCSSIPNSPQKKEIIVENESKDFFKQFHYWATFLSSNIINKAIIRHTIDPYRFKETLLPQLNWVIPAVFKGEINIILNGSIFGYQADNTGGYQLTKVFGKDYLNILKELKKTGSPKEVIRITFENLFKSFFPNFVNKLLYSKNDFVEENHFEILLIIGWSYYSFWRYIFPIYLKFLIKKYLINFKTNKG